MFSVQLPRTGPSGIGLPRPGARVASDTIELYWTAGISGLVLQSRNSFDSDVGWTDVQVPLVQWATSSEPLLHPT